jgi:hypothetical protein
VGAWDPSGQRGNQPHDGLAHSERERQRHEGGHGSGDAVLEHGHLEYQRANALRRGATVITR